MRWGFQVLMMQILVRLRSERRERQPVNLLIEAGHKNAEQVAGFIRQKVASKNHKGLHING